MSSTTSSTASLREDPLFERLMVRFQQDDQDAASELVRLLSARILAFLSRPRLTRAYAEDLLQEFWLRIYQARRSFRAGSPVLPWVYTIANRTRCDGYRRLCCSTAFREVALDEAANQIPHVHPNDLSLYCSQLISSLPKGQREAIVFTIVGGLTTDEVAGSIRSTRSAVKQKVHRGYQKLRVMYRNDSRAGRAA